MAKFTLWMNDVIFLWIEFACKYESYCKYCSANFLTKLPSNSTIIINDSLLNHEESVHTENVPLLEDSKCKLCSKVFSTKASLLNHEESVANRIR